MMSLPTAVPPTPRTLPNGALVKEWDRLIPGMLVEVWASGLKLHVAFVDEVTEDGSIIWLIERGLGSRRLFLSSDVTLYLT